MPFADADPSQVRSMPLPFEGHQRRGATMSQPDLPVWMRFNLDPDTIEDVVTHINRVRPNAQKRLAKDIVTIAYLDAGRRLVERSLLQPTMADGSYAFLDWLTRESVCAEVGRGPNPLPRQASDGSFRDRWRSKGDYLADLVAYLNWNLHWEPHKRLAYEVMSRLLDPDTPLATAVEEAAYEDLSLMTDSEHRSARLTQLALQPLAVGNAKVRAAASSLYADVLQAWGQTYEHFLDGRSMRLRPGTSLNELAIILTAVADGLAMRALVEGTSNVMDAETRTSLLGTAAFALLLACLDQGDGRSMRELVNELGQNFLPATDP
jgi:hypothetical protein